MEDLPIVARKKDDEVNDSVVEKDAEVEEARLPTARPRDGADEPCTHGRPRRRLKIEVKRQRMAQQVRQGKTNVL